MQKTLTGWGPFGISFCADSQTERKPFGRTWIICWTTLTQSPLRCARKHPWTVGARSHTSVTSCRRDSAPDQWVGAKRRWGGSSRSWLPEPLRLLVHRQKKRSIRAPLNSWKSPIKDFFLIPVASLIQTTLLRSLLDWTRLRHYSTHLDHFEAHFFPTTTWHQLDIKNLTLEKKCGRIWIENMLWWNHHCHKYLERRRQLCWRLRKSIVLQVLLPVMSWSPLAHRLPAVAVTAAAPAAAAAKKLDYQNYAA